MREIYAYSYSTYRDQLTQNRIFYIALYLGPVETKGIDTRSLLNITLDNELLAVPMHEDSNIFVKGFFRISAKSIYNITHEEVHQVLYEDPITKEAIPPKLISVIFDEKDLLMLELSACSLENLKFSISHPIYSKIHIKGLSTIGEVIGRHLEAESLKSDLPVGTVIL